MGAGCCPLESSVLQRFGKISHRTEDFVLCKTLENNLIRATLQYTELSSSVTQNSVHQGKMKCKLPLGQSSIIVFVVSGLQIKTMDY